MTTLFASCVQLLPEGFMPLSRTRKALVLHAAAILVACGGGESISPIPLVELPSELRMALEGPWPDGRLYYAVLDRQNWVILWGERRSYLDCDAAPNQQGCSPAEAPMVDFSAFTLIGVNLSNKGKFSSEKEPFRVYENDNGIIVEYGFVGLSVPSADPASAFGLIPKSSQPITFQARP